MEQRWSLNDLYTSFESEEFTKEYELLQNKVEIYKKWAEENLVSQEKAQEKIEFYLNNYNKMMSLVTKLAAFARLSLSVEARNIRALQVVEGMEKVMTELTQPNVKFQRWLSDIGNIDEIIASSDIIKEHEFNIKEAIENARYLLSEQEEVVISRMKQTGSSAWTKLQELLTSTLLVEINLKGEDKKLPLPVVRNLAFDPNPEVRKTAYYAELKSYEKIVDSSASALNGIKGEVINISRMRGYKSPLQVTLRNSRMDEETLNALLQAMVEYHPQFRRYLKKKSQILGYQKGLPFYELFAPIGKVSMQFSYQEAWEFIVNNFRKFSNKLADFADHAFKNRWIDAEPREGKRGGAFCSNIHPIKQSRILSNFDGSFGNMTTLAHELGHGYHGQCLFDQTLMNSRYPMPIAETASIFCENIVVNAALEKATREERLAIIENDLQSSSQTIVDIYSRFLFEDEVFKRREKSSLPAKELNEIMLNAQKEVYGDGLDHDFLHPYMWVNKPHYYYPDSNYYNFPYAFGELFVKGLYAQYLKQGDAFIKEYDRLLSITGRHNLVDVARTAGIDLHSIEFWRSSLSLIKESIDEFISLT
ncbi:MAG: Oligoendopeptidase F, plasmid [candidate division WS2 bacterium]|nr:Oligoendopeptidase F, plasmid [Candidatus Psychracetigena formicireducens]MBT9151062.1 Oligoendopeptidase F, plasmid [Candidatus Psychracetigena formicireducens]